MNRTYEEIKNDFKKTILDLEKELLLSNDNIDRQRIVNMIVKKFDEEAAADLKKGA